ncbi:MAG: low molecular weight phosphotyrosine protein phosphatase [Bacteroidia bacterium]|nr:low molecular weight phosphotyrosine protein phosphatase [Bacteroidia bacterium]
MQKLLFVCLGNICRSPLAEGIMLHYIKKNKLPLIVDSAAIAPYHIGENPDIRTIKNALKHNIKIEHLIARQFQIDDFEKFDKIYVMDFSHYEHLRKIAPNAQLFEQKVDYLMNVVYPNQNIEVPDPYYGTEQDFEKVFQMIHTACTKIIEIYSYEKNMPFK